MNTRICKPKRNDGRPVEDYCFKRLPIDKFRHQVRKDSGGRLADGAERIEIYSRCLSCDKANRTRKRRSYKKHVPQNDGKLGWRDPIVRAFLC